MISFNPEMTLSLISTRPPSHLCSFHFRHILFCLFSSDLALLGSKIFPERSILTQEVFREIKQNLLVTNSKTEKERTRQRGTKNLTYQPLSLPFVTISLIWYFSLVSLSCKEKSSDKLTFENHRFVYHFKVFSMRLSMTGPHFFLIFSFWTKKITERTRVNQAWMDKDLKGDWAKYKKMSYFSWWGSILFILFVSHGLPFFWFFSLGSSFDLYSLSENHSNSSKGHSLNYDSLVSFLFLFRFFFFCFLWLEFLCLLLICFQSCFSAWTI